MSAKPPSKTPRTVSMVGCSSSGSLRKSTSHSPNVAAAVVIGRKRTTAT